MMKGSIKLTGILTLSMQVMSVWQTVQTTYSKCDRKYNAIRIWIYSAWRKM